MDAPEVIVEAQGVSKTFKLPHEKTATIKTALINFRKRRTYEKQQVLNDISFNVNQGEFFGIVGRNGSGKSTLLKLLAGIYTPTEGSIHIHGSLTPFIELGVGFNQELTGRENVFLNGSLLGFSRVEMKAMYDDIVKFAELKKFMDQKLKNYSSGMQVRLAFSIAIKVNSDILLLDEVLAVGDAAFQKKCFDYFRKLKKDKKTVLFISHNMNAVREYCDRAILIEEGKIVAAGSAEEVAKKYTKMFMEAPQETINHSSDKRWGTGQVRVGKVTTNITDEVIEVRVTYDVHEGAEQPIFGISVINPTGIKVFESNTGWEKIKTSNYVKGAKVEVSWQIPNIFTNGTNYISVAAANADATEFYDWWDEAAVFSIDKDTITTALTAPKYNLKVTNVS